MPVHEVVESGVSVDEHVLLGCFGLDLAAVRHSGWVLHGSVLPTELAAPDLPRLAIGMISW